MSIKLIPFEPLPIKYQAEVYFSLHKISSKKIELNYTISGDFESLNTINLIKDSLDINNRSRSHDLWKNTCFEWFIKSKDQSKYWEFNAAPNGFWNFYELESYRKNLQESKLNLNLDFSTSLYLEKNEPCFFKYNMNITLIDSKSNLSDLLNTNNSILFSPNIILKWVDNTVSYFAIKHPEEKPDFHSDFGFIPL